MQTQTTWTTTTTTTRRINTRFTKRTGHAIYYFLIFYIFLFNMVCMYFTTFIHHVYCCLMFNSENSQRLVLCVWFMKIIYGNCWLKIHDNAIPFPYAQANAALYLIIYIYVSWNVIVCDILLHCRYYNSFLSWDCILTIYFSPYISHVNNSNEPW